MTTPNESFSVQDNLTFSENPKELNKQLTILNTRLARAINSKDIAIYANQEILCGQRIFGFTSPGVVNPQVFRSIFRKTFYFTTVLTFAHGITGMVDATRIFGTCQTAGIWRQMGNNIELTVDPATGGNIVITPGVGYPVITKGYITLEYTKEK